jgi:hypothetical protein
VGDHGQKVVLHLVGLLELAGQFLLLDPQLRLPMGVLLGLALPDVGASLAAQHDVEPDGRHCQRQEQHHRVVRDQHHGEHDRHRHTGDGDHRAEQPRRGEVGRPGRVEVHLDAEQQRLDGQEDERARKGRRQRGGSGGLPAAEGQPHTRAGREADGVVADVEGHLVGGRAVQQAREDDGGGL